MAHLRKSINKGSFRREKANAELCELYDEWDRKTAELELDPVWQKDNLEYDLRSTDWIINKASASDKYAQNLYAALCNNSFIKRDVWPLLTNKQWTCSWRYAGGIVADILEKGDYIDWYCSGIRDIADYEKPKDDLGYVGEGTVTQEIKDDLFNLGWLVVEDNDSKDI